MGLTEYENEQLKDLELRLAADDPALAKTLTRQTEPPRRSIVVGVLTMVLGLAVTLGALISTGPLTVPAGVLGFVVILIGALAVFRSPKQGPTKPRRKFTDRMEQRWAARKNPREK